MTIVTILTYPVVLLASFMFTGLKYRKCTFRLDEPHLKLLIERNDILPLQFLIIKDNLFMYIYLYAGFCICIVL